MKIVLKISQESLSGAAYQQGGWFFVMFQEPGQEFNPKQRRQSYRRPPMKHVKEEMGIISRVTTPEY